MKIMIVDDDRLIVQALQTIVEASGVEVIGLGYDGLDALRLCRERQPDVLMMDIRMTQMSGLDAARELLETQPELKILLLTTFKDPVYLSQAMALGCRGYLLKQNFGAILPALQACHAGSLVFDEAIFSSLSTPQIEDDARLSERQNEIQRLIAEGLSNREIAERLFISEGTVRNQISQIFDIIGVRDRTQLVVNFYKQLLGTSAFQ